MPDGFDFLSFALTSKTSHDCSVSDPMPAITYLWMVFSTFPRPREHGTPLRFDRKNLGMGLFTIYMIHEI